MATYKGWFLEGIKAVLNDVLEGEVYEDAAVQAGDGGGAGTGDAEASLSDGPDAPEEEKPQKKRKRTQSSPIGGFLGSFVGRGRTPVISQAEQERRIGLGITEPLQEYVRNLCQHPQTWVDFPLDSHLLKQKKAHDVKEQKAAVTPLPVPHAAGVSAMSAEDAAVAAVSAFASSPPRSDNRMPGKAEAETEIRKQQATEAEKKQKEGQQEKKEKEDEKEEEKEDAKEEDEKDKEEKEEEKDKEKEEALDADTLESLLELSEKEQKHAELMLAEVEELKYLRYHLCPLELSEERFWRIYFLLVGNKLTSQFLKPSDEHFCLPLVRPGRQASAGTNAYSRMMTAFLPDDGKQPAGAISMFGKAGSSALSTAAKAETKEDEVLVWWHAHVHGFRVMPRYEATFCHPSHGSQGAASSWAKMRLQELKEEKPKVFKLLLRCGVPDAYRRETWLLSPSRRMVDEEETPSALSTPRSHVTEEGEEEEEERKLEHDGLNWGCHSCLLYGRRLRASFGPEAPVVCDPIPTFGGNIAFHQHHCISNGGVQAAKRILVVLALTFPHLDYAPVLPDLTALLLMFMPEDEAYRVLETLVCESIERCHYLALGNRALTLYQRTFTHFLHRSFHDLSEHAAALGVDLSEIFRDWLSCLFVGILPLQVVLRVVDCLLHEGSTVLFRVALAILSLAKAELLLCQEADRLKEKLSAWCLAATDADRLLSHAWQFKAVTHRNLAKQHRLVLESGQLDDVAASTMTVFTAPVLHQPSSILAPEQFESLWSWVPARFQLQELARVFTTEEDGFNLKSLIHHCAGHMPTVLLIETTDGQSFGVFIANEWKTVTAETQFYGSGENFLFAMAPTERKFAWKAGRPEYHMMLTDVSAVFGGGGDGFGLQLDIELWHGVSQPCATYANSGLHVGSPQFECKTLEAYAIQ